jgi:hypothetical protein
MRLPVYILMKNIMCFANMIVPGQSAIGVIGCKRRHWCKPSILWLNMITLNGIDLNLVLKVIKELVTALPVPKLFHVIRPNQPREDLQNIGWVFQENFVLCRERSPWVKTTRSREEDPSPPMLKISNNHCNASDTPHKSYVME